MSRTITTLTTVNSTYEVSEGPGGTRLTCLRGTFEGLTCYLEDWDVLVVQAADGTWETRGAVFQTTTGGVIETSRVMSSERVAVEDLVPAAGSLLAGFRPREPRPSSPQHEHCVFDWDERPSEANGHRWVVRDLVDGCPGCRDQARRA